MSIPGSLPLAVRQAAVLAFTARYFSGLPFQPAVTVMLREFLPGAKHVACNELQVSPCLCSGFCGKVPGLAAAEVSPRTQSWAVPCAARSLTSM